MKFRSNKWLAAAFIAATASFSVMAAEGDSAADAGSKPSAAASEAAHQALDKRMKTVFDSLEGVGTPLTADMFSAEFNKQVTPDQVQKAMKQLRDGVGACKMAGRSRANGPAAAAYLLDCQKGFVPVELGLEDKAPYKIQSLFFGGTFWRVQ